MLKCARQTHRLLFYWLIRSPVVSNITPKNFKHTPKKFRPIQENYRREQRAIIRALQASDVQEVMMTCVCFARLYFNHKTYTDENQLYIYAEVLAMYNIGIAGKFGYCVNILTESEIPIEKKCERLAQTDATFKDNITQS